MCKLTDKVPEVVCHDSTFLDLVKNILDFVIAFEKEYRERLVATCTVDIVKDMKASAFLTG